MLHMFVCLLFIFRLQDPSATPARTPRQHAASAPSTGTIDRHTASAFVAAAAATESRGHKRSHSSRTTGTAVLNQLTAHVGSLVGSLVETPSDSPERKRRAWNILEAEEELSDNELADARRIFRGPAELADEFLSFGQGRKRARTLWVQHELSRIRGE